MVFMEGYPFLERGKIMYKIIYIAIYWQYHLLMHLKLAAFNAELILC